MPFNQVVGSNVRRLRLERGLTLDEIASNVRFYGLKWTTSRVIEFEKGQIPATLGTMMLVAFALGQLSNKHVRLAEMVEFDGWLELPTNTSIRSETFRAALNGAEVNLMTDSDYEQEQIDKDTSIQAADVIQEVPRGVTVHDLKFMHEYAGLADERAAKKLGMTLDEFLGYCWLIWHYPMGETAWKLAGHKASPQAVGQVSRKLIKEMQRFVEEHKTGNSG